MDEKMTFGDLEDLVEHWAADLKDFQREFVVQSEEIEKLWWRVESNNTKVIANKLGLLSYMHKQLEASILKAYTIQQVMEQAVAQLEKLVTALEGKVLNDTLRETYEFAANINLCLTDCKTDVELLSRDTKRIETNVLKDPVEQLAKIMVKLLESLVHIETNIEHIKNKLRWIEEEYTIILRQRLQAN